MTFHPFNIDLIEMVSRSLKTHSEHHKRKYSLRITPKREQHGSLTPNFDPEQQLLETLDQWLTQNLTEYTKTEKIVHYTQELPLSTRAQSFLTEIVEIVDKKLRNPKSSLDQQPEKVFLLKQAFEHIQKTQRKSTDLSHYL